MMDDLIRRNDAIKITWIEPQFSDPINVLTEVRDRIEELPTVDAVQVVRCKDCKWWDCRDLVEQYGGCERPCSAIRSDCWVSDNWFCADGERKEQEDG